MHSFLLLCIHYTPKLAFCQCLLLQCFQTLSTIFCYFAQKWIFTTFFEYFDAQKKRTGHKFKNTPCPLILWVLRSEIISAIMAIVYLSATRKPFFWLPNIPLFLRRFYDCHPPIITHKYHKSNHPFNHYPHQVYPTK